MKNTLSRRYFLGTALALIGASMLPGMAWAAIDDYVQFNILRKRGDNFPYKLSDTEWRKRLNDIEYAIIRDGGNEEAGTSNFIRDRRKGIYSCRGCNAPVFSSNAKLMANDFPTFRAPISRKAIGLSSDFKAVLPRTEIHCANCGGHLGYRSSADNAAETWRYSINGTSLRFTLN